MRQAFLKKPAASNRPPRMTTAPAAIGGMVCDVLSVVCNLISPTRAMSLVWLVVQDRKSRVR